MQLVGCKTSYRRKPVSLRYRLRIIHNSDPAPNYPGGCYPPPLLWKKRGWNRNKADRDPDLHRGDKKKTDETPAYAGVTVHQPQITNH